MLPPEGLSIQNSNNPFDYAVAVVPADGIEFDTATRALYVGTGVDINVQMWDQSLVLFNKVPSGTILPIRAIGVIEPGTTATDIVALW